MAAQTGGANAPDLGSPQANHSNRPARNPFPLGVVVGFALAIIGAALLLFGVAGGPSFVSTHYGPDWWIDAMRAIGQAMLAGIPLGFACLTIGVAACVTATWLRPRYPGRIDLKNNLAVRLYDEFGHILHPGDVAIKVLRRRGVYRVLIRIEAVGLQYEEKRIGTIKAAVGMGFRAPEVYPYRGPGIYDLDVLIVSRLVSDGYLDRWADAVARIRSRKRGEH